MATLKEITAADIKTSKSVLNQLIDVIQEDLSGSATRKKYQVFVTGGVGPGVTSSLFQTVYDQDFTLQTANPMFDMTVGLFVSSSTVISSSTGVDTAGKRLFKSSSLMMREKVDNYRQFAQVLLGGADKKFVAPFGTTADETSTDTVNEAMFISFKRLFARDQVKRGTFAMRWYQSASRAPLVGTNESSDPLGNGILHYGPNLYVPTVSGSKIFTDAGATTNKKSTFGGQVADIVDSSDTSRKVGLMFYDHGTAVFDLGKIMSGSQHVSGAISAMSDAADAGDSAAGTAIIGGINTDNKGAAFIPDLMCSASIDDIIDHISTVRFSSGTKTAMTFQNITNINSTLIFCRSTADEFNYSSNPTFTDSNNRIVVIEEGSESQRTVTFPTTVGLYDANSNLLAVAKLSRPVEKRDDKDVTFRIRLDF